MTGTDVLLIDRKLNGGHGIAVAPVPHAGRVAQFCGGSSTLSITWMMPFFAERFGAVTLD